MARSRTVKPAFFLNENLALKNPFTRLLFIGLWCLADFKGRLEDRPMRIKASILPYEQVDVDQLLNELALEPEPFIVRYEVQGARYIEILNFSKHQNPSTKEKQAGSLIPPRPISDSSGTLPGRSGDVTGTHPAPPITYYPLPSTSHKLPSAEPENLSANENFKTFPVFPENSQQQEAIGSGVSVSDENLKLAQTGLEYLLSLNHPNFSSPQWVKGYLGLQFQELEQKQPAIPKEEILRLWMDTSDLATSRNASAPQWLKTTFANKLKAWTPEQAKTHTHTPASQESSRQKLEALLEFPLVRHIVTEEIFEVASLEARPENCNGFYSKQGGAFFPIGQLEGLKEAPTNA